MAGNSEVFNEMRRNNEGTDLIIIIEGCDQRFPVHSLILRASESAYFKQASGNQENQIRISFNIENFRAEHFEKIISYTYTNNINLTVPNVQVIHQISVQLGYENLKKKCISFMEEEDNLQYNCYEIWKYAISIRLNSVESACVLFIIKNFVSFCDKHIDELNFEMIRAIFCKGKDSNINHKDRLNNLVKWFKIQPGARDFEFNELLQYINFAKIDTDFKRNVILKDEQIKNNPEVLRKCVEEVDEISDENEENAEIIQSATNVISSVPIKDGIPQIEHQDGTIAMGFGRKNEGVQLVLDNHLRKAEDITVAFKGFVFKRK